MTTSRSATVKGVISESETAADLREARVQEALTGLLERKKTATTLDARLPAVGAASAAFLKQKAPEQFNTAGVYARVPLLKDCTFAFLNDLSAFAGPQRQHGQFYDINSIITQAGEPANSMFIVHRGLLEATSGRGEPAVVLGEGETVGEATLLGMEWRRPTTVRAKTMCHLYEVPSHAFMRSLQLHVHERRHFETMRRQMRTNKGANGEGVGRAPALSSKVSKVPKPAALAALSQESPPMQSSAAGSGAAVVSARGRPPPSNMDKVTSHRDAGKGSSGVQSSSSGSCSSPIKLQNLLSKMSSQDAAQSSTSTLHRVSSRESTAASGTDEAVGQIQEGTSTLAAALDAVAGAAGGRKTAAVVSAPAPKKLWFRPPESDNLNLPERLGLTQPEIEDRPPFWWRNVRRPATPEDVACIDTLKRSLRLDSQRGFLLVQGAVEGGCRG